MTLQQLHYAITISETGSLNKAAEILYVAQPSLTGAMQELEKELGVTIFHRSGRGVTLTNDGVEFITYARQVYHQYELLMEKYGACGTLKKKFGVSAQHYSFAVKAFVEMVKQFNTAEYEFAIRETQTRTVIEDVSTLRSEIGILYLSSFNRAAITKLLKALRTGIPQAHRLPGYTPICGRDIRSRRRGPSGWSSFTSTPASRSSRAGTARSTLPRKFSPPTNIRAPSRPTTAPRC